MTNRTFQKVRLGNVINIKDRDDIAVGGGERGVHVAGFEILPIAARQVASTPALG